MNDTDMTGQASETAFTHTVSEADLALFALVTGALNLGGDTQLPLGASHRQPAPHAFLAALLTSAVARLSSRPDIAPILSAQFRFIGPAYSDETVRVTATTPTADPTSGALRVTARCESGEGHPLAEADFLLRPE